MPAGDVVDALERTLQEKRFRFEKLLIPPLPGRVPGYAIPCAIPILKRHAKGLMTISRIDLPLTESRGRIGFGKARCFGPPDPRGSDREADQDRGPPSVSWMHDGECARPKRPDQSL